ncbi:MAG: LysR family transcriptional regulator [Roseiflexaceae bacterium]|nr:LysR family transcriptional regulator [Roseiflexaceae bacterium]
MELHHLRYFEAVARIGNMTRAAAELLIAQPSLSKQIQALEQSVGTRLFDRVGRRIELTDAGLLLLPYARRVLREVAAARAALRERADLTSGHVAIGAPPTIGARLLPHALATFNMLHHNIELVLHEAGSGPLVRQLLAGEVDLAVVPVPQIGTAWIELFTEELVVAVSPDHPLAGSSSIASAQLANQGFIMFPPSYGLRDRTLQFWREAGLAPRVVLDGGEMATVLRLAAVGLGVALVPRLALDGSEGLVGLSVRDATLRRTIGLTWHPERQLSPAAAALRTFLTEQLGRNLP